MNKKNMLFMLPFIAFASTFCVNRDSDVECETAYRMRYNDRAKKKLIIDISGLDCVGKSLFNGIDAIEELELVADCSEFKLFKNGCFSGLKHLKSLSISGVYLGRINSDFFLGLKNLKNLLIENVVVSGCLRPEIFSELTGLKRLGIDARYDCGTRASFSPGTFYGLCNLESIAIATEELVPGMFIGLDNIREINLLFDDEEHIFPAILPSTFSGICCFDKFAIYGCHRDIAHEIIKVVAELSPDAMVYHSSTKEGDFFDSLASGNSGKYDYPYSCGECEPCDTFSCDCYTGCCDCCSSYCPLSHCEYSLCKECDCSSSDIYTHVCQNTCEDYTCCDPCCCD